MKNIKKNNITNVKLLVEKYFQDRLNSYFLKICYSYSYDCFDYFYERLKTKNGSDYFFPYYKKVNIKNNVNHVQLGKIFNYDFNVGGQSNKKDKDDNTIDRLRYQIVNSLVNQNKFSTVISLVKDITQTSKNTIFQYYLSNYIVFNEEHIKTLLNILTIDQSFFEKKILDSYHPNLDKSLYLFIKKNYNIDKKYYISCFLRVYDEEVIQTIDKDFNITLNQKIEKIHESLSFNYKYQSSQHTLNLINFYQSIGYLNEYTILQSFKKNYHEIIIDYTYLPLLKLSDAAEIAMLKKNLETIIFYKDYQYNYKDKNNIKNIVNKLDCYFDFIKDKIDININNDFIEQLLEPIAITSEDILIYFYKKFPNLFIKQACKIFTRYFNDRKDINYLIEEIFQENEKNKKEKLLEICLNMFLKLSYHCEEHNTVYFLLKNVITEEKIKDILYKKVVYHSALPIIKDILQQDNFQNINTICDLFLNAICGFSSNACYLLENYSIDITTLTGAFIKLSFQEDNETNRLLAQKILEKHIKLSEYEQDLIKQNNIDLYKIYISYSLNDKLNDKYQIKNTKEKRVKI